ncbi:hypothetical protein ORJ04_00375 [Rheinheimera baltica]|uniref:Uncharacterized protein n=1 Tax=Rheinheimera baltica TaxID=67576 RepID=A0ABT9HTE6_9GAMM|nr:hypothetical protein [Rheinheimera baltica]MDP5134402.1 hypothetical protein [Rheinheimera baltica]
MEYTIPLWYTFLVIAFLLSLVIAYPSVALFVTWPIQRKLRQTKQDYLSDWIIWPFQSGFYAMGVLVPFTRWRHERNRDMVDAYELIRQAATPLQWWLSMWLAVSMIGMVVFLFFALALEFMGVWSLGNG